MRYATVSSSPFVPGARPSNSSEDSTLTCAITPFMSTSGICASVTRPGFAQAVAIETMRSTARLFMRRILAYYADMTIRQIALAAALTSAAALTVPAQPANAQARNLTLTAVSGIKVGHHTL